MSVVERAECPVCGFWKNNAANVGGPCRRIGCDGTVALVKYVPAEQLREAVEDRDRYWQALLDIAGHENWEPKTMGDIARAALDPPTSGGQ